MGSVRFVPDAKEKLTYIWNMPMSSGKTFGELFRRKFGIELKLLTDKIDACNNSSSNQPFISLIFSEIFSSLGLFLSGDPSVINSQRLYECIRKLPSEEQALFNGATACDIGCGQIVPTVFEASINQLTGGVVKCIDPDILVIIDSINNFEVYQREVELDDSRDCALVTSMYPCEATLEVLEAAYVNGTGMYLALCNCDHGAGSSKAWADCVEKIAAWYNERFCDGKRPLIVYEPTELWPTVPDSPIYFLPPVPDNIRRFK